MKSFLQRLKLRLQFSGWLQYLLNFQLSLVFFILAACASLLGSPRLAYSFVLIGLFLLAVLIFDLITVKLQLHPRERMPRRKDDLGMFDLMRVRRSCRSFQARKLTPGDHDELMESVQRHSGAPKIGEFPIRFEYVSAALTVWPVVGASEFLVAIVPSEYNRLAVIDVGRSLQKIVIDATRMGLATCWIGPGADHASIMRHLGDRFDPNQDHIICVCAVGYKSNYKPLFVKFMTILQHRRKPLSSLFFADASFKEPLNIEAQPFVRFGRNYEVCQWSPSSYNGQTTRCVAVKKGEGAPIARFDFYAATNSRYYAPVALGIWCANWEMGCEALGIQGHFAVLPAGDRSAQDEEAHPKLPVYDVSWMSDAVL